MQAVPRLRDVLMVVPRAVLCSEMGVHLAPCGRFLAACVAMPQVCVGLFFQLRICLLTAHG